MSHLFLHPFGRFQGLSVNNTARGYQENPKRHKWKEIRIKTPQVIKKEWSGICVCQRPVRYPRGVMFDEQTQKQMMGADVYVCVCVNMCVTDGVVGEEVTAAREQPPPPTISIKLDDALTPSIGSDVKHGKNVPDSISARSSDSYQRASSVSTQNKPFQTRRHTHTHTPPTSHSSIFTLHWNQGCVAVPGLSKKRKKKIFSLLFSAFPATLNTQSSFSFRRPGGVNYLHDKQGDVVSVSQNQVPYHGGKEADKFTWQAWGGST